ncbi:MAG: hypothetical protein M1365_10595, partial [Actinobacteria bacterium]|nr:hypothetical protein [Actinomycetota bacterium]
MNKKFLSIAVAVILLVAYVFFKNIFLNSGKEPVSKFPLKHIVYVIQENHTFDSYFGTYPGADGFDLNNALPQNPGESPSVKPVHSSNYTLKGDEATMAYFAPFDKGRPDANGMVKMEYFQREDIPNYWKYADNFVLLDKMFSAVVVRYSIPSHFYAIAATAEGWMTNNIEKDELSSKTIIDLFKKKGITWRLYSGESFNKLSGAPADWNYILAFRQHKNDKEVIKNIVPAKKFYEDVKSENLPQFSWIFPEIEDSEHPPYNIRKGMNYVTGIVNAVMKSKYWNDTAIIIVWDDYGYFYDHVKPLMTDQFGPGPRVPGLIISAYAKKGFIDHTTYNTSSPLKLMETLYELPSLTL